MGLLDSSDATQSNAPSVTAIMVTLTIGEDQSLFVLLASDGAINRMGNGSEHNIESDLFIGQTSLDAFHSVAPHTQAVIDQWLGGYGDPNPVGKLCKLSIGFRTADGQELVSQWRYGAESQGPPPEVAQLVIEAVKATNPWYEQQKQMVATRAS